MSDDGPGRQPFAGQCTANPTAGNSDIGEIGPVPPHKRLVVESVSCALTTSTSGSVYTLSLNGPFTLYMIPVLISDGPYNLRQYRATHAVRFYVESGRSIQFQACTVGDGGQADCYVSGYFLDT
jgi:hypothetical protein